MWQDEIVEETRRIREEHAARFNFDLKAIWTDLKEQEKHSGREIVSLPARRTPQEPTESANANLSDSETPMA